MAQQLPTLADLREGRVTIEAFLASRNGYVAQPFRTRVIQVASK